MVPVERIELPTFGLQNHCSTAELNRQIIVVFCLPPPISTGQARRQIPELPDEGYYYENPPRRACPRLLTFAAPGRRCGTFPMKCFAPECSGPNFALTEAAADVV